MKNDMIGYNGITEKLAEQEKQIEVLRAALRPFADYAVSEITPDEPNDQFVAGSTQYGIALTVSDFRNAAACIGYEL